MLAHRLPITVSIKKSRLQPLTIRRKAVWGIDHNLRLRNLYPGQKPMFPSLGFGMEYTAKIIFWRYSFAHSLFFSHLLYVICFYWKLERSEAHTSSNRLGFFSLHLECRPCCMVSVDDDLLIYKFNILPLAVLSICTSIIFTIEYNFTPTEIVGIILIN